MKTKNNRASKYLTTNIVFRMHAIFIYEYSFDKCPKFVSYSSSPAFRFVLKESISSKRYCISGLAFKEDIGN